MATIPPPNPAPPVDRPADHRFDGPRATTQALFGRSVRFPQSLGDDGVPRFTLSESWEPNTDDDDGRRRYLPGLLAAMGIAAMVAGGVAMASRLHVGSTTASAARGSDLALPRPPQPDPYRAPISVSVPSNAVTATTAANNAASPAALPTAMTKRIGTPISAPMAPRRNARVVLPPVRTVVPPVVTGPTIVSLAGTLAAQSQCGGSQGAGWTCTMNVSAASQTTLSATVTAADAGTVCLQLVLLDGGVAVGPQPCANGTVRYSQVVPAGAYDLVIDEGGGPHRTAAFAGQMSRSG